MKRKHPTHGLWESLLYRPQIDFHKPYPSNVPIGKFITDLSFVVVKPWDTEWSLLCYSPFTSFLGLQGLKNTVDKASPEVNTVGAQALLPESVTEKETTHTQTVLSLT